MSKFTNLSILILFCFLLNGCSLFEDDNYEALPSELVEFTPDFTPAVAWSKNATSGTNDDYSNLGAWLQDDSIVMVGHKGDVVSMQTTTGKELWETDLDIEVNTGPGGGNGLILIGSKEGELVALDESTGKQIWTQQLSSEILSPAKASNGVVVARTADGRLAGLSAADGTRLWSYQRAVPLLSLRGAGEVVIANQMVIAGYANGKLVALSLADGLVIWETSIAVPRGRTELERLVDIDSAPVIKNDEVYVVAFHGRLASVSMDSGRVIWYRDFSSRTGLDVDAGYSVYVSDDSDYVWALQDGTGDALWRQTRLLRRKITAPVIVGNNVIVGDYDGYVHWISRDDGRFVARERIADHAIRSKPITKDDLVFVTASDGTLTALRIN
jgi:outer membrane protein assembly factor BamB